MVPRSVDIAGKLPLLIVPCFSIEHRIVEFDQVPAGMPFAPNGSTPDHHILPGRSVQQLHLQHHAASVVENPGLGIINRAGIAVRELRDNMCKHLLKGLPKMLTADLMNDLGIENIAAHADPSPSLDDVFLPAGSGL